MEDETLQGAQQRQAAAAAAAAQAQARADEAAAAMDERIEALTSEFAAEIGKLGNPGAAPLGDHGQGWVLCEPNPGNISHEPNAGLALTTKGTWLILSADGTPAAVNPAEYFESAPLFGVYARHSSLRQLESARVPHQVIQIRPQGSVTPIEMHVDADVLRSPASFLAHYLAALLAQLPQAYPPPPPPLPVEAAPPLPPPPTSWWQRFRAR
ncbi:MAG: hypothetical protein WKF96_09055 [Solirubrobacteraceae bacterium]